MSLNDEHSSIEERLTKLENLLDDMNERQRLTRFDTVMFLVYPVVIAATTLLASGFVQYETLGNVKVLGVALSSLLLYGSLGIACGILYAFLMFVLAYLADDLRRRILSARWVAWGATFLGAQLLLVFSVAPITSSLEAITQGSNSSVPTILAFIFVMSLTFLVISLADGMQELFAGLAVSWSRNNIPVRFSKMVPLKDFSKSLHFSFLIGKIAWAAMCIDYAVMVALALLTKGLQQNIKYHSVTAFFLLSLTAVVFLRLRIRAVFKRVKKVVSVTCQSLMAQAFHKRPQALVAAGDRLPSLSFRKHPQLVETECRLGTFPP